MPIITKLEPNEVFVYGANASGFHGAGAAGYAFKGSAANDWKTNPFFQTAYRELQLKEARRPYDETKLIGKWAVLGEIGFSKGKEGKSYGVITTQRPGFQGYVDYDYVRKEIQFFVDFALKRPKWIFLCADFGLARPKGFLWFTEKQMNEAFQFVFQYWGRPANVIFPSYVKI